MLPTIVRESNKKSEMRLFNTNAIMKNHHKMHENLYISLFSNPLHLKCSTKPLGFITIN